MAKLAILPFFSFLYDFLLAGIGFKISQRLCFLSRIFICSYDYTQVLWHSYLFL